MNANQENNDSKPEQEIQEETVVERRNSLIQMEESPKKNLSKSLVIDFSETSIKQTSIISSINAEDFLPIKDFDCGENFVFLEKEFFKIEQSISKVNI